MALSCPAIDCLGNIVASYRINLKYILDTCCIYCPKSNLSHKKNKKYYLCNVCSSWCCINCYAKLLHLQNAKYTTFDSTCCNAYVQFVKDRFNGHNECKLNEYQEDYEMKLKLLTIRYISTKFNVDRFHNDLINVIISFINTKITSFNTKKLSQSKQLSLNEKLNGITQIHPSYLHGKELIPAISYSAMTLVKGKIYSLKVKINSIKGSGRMYIGIISNNYDITCNKALTNIGNCYIYSNYGGCHHNSACKYWWDCRNYRYGADDIIKVVIDMKYGLICFVKNVNNNIMAFKINKFIDYKFIVATYGKGDSYQLLS